MNSFEAANNNESMPTEMVAVESRQVTANSGNTVKLYSVPISADVELSFFGYVPVYASSFDEAASKVQAQIDTKTVSDEILMEDGDTSFAVSYEQLIDYFGITPEISECEIQVDDSDEVDPAFVLKAEVAQLQANISWDLDKQAKLKAFLESLTETHLAAAKN